MFDLLQLRNQIDDPINLLLLAVAIPVGVACLSVPFTIYMAWRAKAADAPAGER